MIPHLAAFVAVWVDQLGPAAPVVKCVLPPDPDQGLRQWIPTAVSLLSIGIGVWIANRSIRKNRELTVWSFSQTSRRDHERWNLDQKKAEWNLLLRSVASVYQITDLVNGWNRKFADRIVSELEPALKEVAIARANCVFLDKFRLNNEGGKKIREFLRFAEIQSQKLQGNLGLFDAIEKSLKEAGSRTDEDTKSQTRCIEGLSLDISSLAEQSYNLLDWLQSEAALDLVKTSEGEEHGAAM
jgi:hypothetical protein